MSEETSEAHLHWRRIRNRTLLTAATVVSFALFWWVGEAMGIPHRRGFSASLMQQPYPGLVLIVCALLFGACVVISGAITSIVQLEAGFYCAALGLSAWSMRGGAMRYTLFASGGPGVFLGLALELVLLYGILTAGWLAMLAVSEVKALPKPEVADEENAEQVIPSQNLIALCGQVLLMMVLMGFFAQTDSKGQTLGAVMACSFLATLAVHSILPARPSTWFWYGPLVVGLVGYVLAWMGNGPWTTGEIHGFAPSLARALPLDYASAGPAGAILAYWYSKHWHVTRAEEAAASTA